MLSHEDNIPNKFRILKIKAHSDEKTTSCLVGLKTNPTILPRSRIELTTSRLHSFIMAKVSYALKVPWRWLYDY